MGLDFEIPKTSPQEAPQNEEKSLSLTLQEIKNTPLKYDDVAYEEAARKDPISREVSTEAFVRLAKTIIDGVPPGSNSFGAMLRILERDSMKGHPNMETFKKNRSGISKKCRPETESPRRLLGSFRIKNLIQLKTRRNPRFLNVYNLGGIG